MLQVEKMTTDLVPTSQLCENENVEDIRTWWLDEDAISATLDKLRKINARAAKRGLNGLYAWRIGAERREPVYLDAPGDQGPQEAAPAYYKVTRELIVEGAAPRIAGWAFLATLAWDDGTLVTRSAPGFTGTIDADAVRPRWCDHCGTDRQRHDTYLVERQDGTRKQVGSSCVKDFLGHNFSPAWLTFGDDLDEVERSARGHETFVAATDEVPAFAASLTSQTAWISVAKAEERYEEASSSVLRAALFPESRKARDLRETLRPTDAHRAEAAKVCHWALAVDATGSEYLANVQRLAQADEVSPRNVGIIGSAVASYWREFNARAEREAAPVSQHIGQAKDRMDLAVTVRGETTFATDFGITHLYTLVTADRNVLKWFSSRDAGLETGSTVKLKGTVKAHETYHDVAQTVITRCKIIAPAPCAPSVAVPDREAC
jgi:hypothetical protein